MEKQCEAAHCEKGETILSKFDPNHNHQTFHFMNIRQQGVNCDFEKTLPLYEC
jgi:hypothetical protein